MIELKTYQDSEKTFFSNYSNDMEQTTIPLASTLKLQYQRSTIITKYWNHESQDENDLLNNGWMKLENKVKLKLHDDQDTLYSLPREVVKGCKCKKRKCGKCQCDKKEQCNKPTCSTFALTCGCKNRVKCLVKTCGNCPCVADLPRTAEMEDVEEEIDVDSNSETCEDSDESDDEVDLIIEDTFEIITDSDSSE